MCRSLSGFPAAAAVAIGRVGGLLLLLGLRVCCLADWASRLLLRKELSDVKPAHAQEHVSLIVLYSAG